MISPLASAHVNLPDREGTCLASALDLSADLHAANALAYSTGFVRLPMMVRCGLLLDLIGAIAIWLAVQLLAPLIGWN